MSNLAMPKCYLCEKGVLRVKEVPYNLYGELIGRFKADVCEQCGETFFDEETSQKISAVTKAKGLWGIEAKTKIGQAGSTLDVRFPKRIIEFFNLKRGEEVNMYPESKKRLIIEM